MYGIIQHIKRTKTLLATQQCREGDIGRAVQTGWKPSLECVLPQCLDSPTTLGVLANSEHSVTLVSLLLSPSVLALTFCLRLKVGHQGQVRPNILFVGATERSSATPKIFQRRGFAGRSHMI